MKYIIKIVNEKTIHVLRRYTYYKAPEEIEAKNMFGLTNFIYRYTSMVWALKCLYMVKGGKHKTLNHTLGV